VVSFSIRKFFTRKTLNSPAIPHPENSPAPQEVETLVALFAEGRYAEAATIAQSMTVRFPLHGLGWKALGLAFRQMGQGADALTCMQKAAALAPNDAETHSNLGITLQDLGRPGEAEASYRRALEIKPDFVEAHSNLGNSLQEQGRLDEAEASYRRASEIDPDSAMAHSNLGNFLQEQDRLFEAEASCRRTLQIRPDFAEAHNNLGNTLRGQGRLVEAEASYRQALEIKPGFVEAYSNLGVALNDLGRLGEAEASYRRALQIQADYAEAHYNLGNTLRGQGRLGEAVAALRRAVSIKPNFVIAHSNLLFCLSHDPGASPEEVFAEHRAFGDRFEAPFRGRWPQHRNLPDPGRRLRVGFVSADLRTHAVSSFVEPLWAVLDPKQVEIWVYSNHRLEDEVTLRLKGLAHQWRKVANLSDGELADQVGKDEIDILFDLSGHTAGNRLLAFARKPAPIQVSWIGNPNTTGLQAMDYYLADRFSAPPGLLDALFTEQIVRLPSGALFQPLDLAPAVNGLPALESGVVTFGSFNRNDKLVEGVVALWARVLNAVPGSRMLLGGLPDASQKENLARQFARHGVDRGRLIFHLRVGMSEYLALHHQVDLILDAFPFGGGTTSCHAAWMGVPVLTLVGKTLSSRTVYENPWLRVTEEDVQTPAGARGVYGVIRHHSPGVCILPLDVAGCTWIVGQHRHALGRYTWELPAGAIGPDGDALAGARRELSEETGLAAERWHRILHLGPINAVTNLESESFLAWQLTPGAPHPDAGEELAPRRLPFADVLSMVLSGAIASSISVATVLQAHVLALHGQLPAEVTPPLRAGR